MKKLSLLLILSLSFLVACQEDKTDADNTEANASSPTAVTTTATTENNEGESLHTENCTRCHGSEVYTRADRKVTSLDALGAQVRMCDSQLQTQLFPEDMEKLTQYLNQTYYKF